MRCWLHRHLLSLMKSFVRLSTERVFRKMQKMRMYFMSLQRSEQLASNLESFTAWYMGAILALSSIISRLWSNTWRGVTAKLFAGYAWKVGSFLSASKDSIIRISLSITLIKETLELRLKQRFYRTLGVIFARNTSSMTYSSLITWIAIICSVICARTITRLYTTRTIPRWRITSHGLTTYARSISANRSAMWPLGLRLSSKLTLPSNTK